MVACVVTAPSAQAADPPSKGVAAPPELVGLLSALMIVEGDYPAHEWTATLARRSPTFREMLGVLLRTPHMRVTLRSRTDLRRTTGLAGRGTFATHDGRVYGLLEFDRSRLDPVIQLRALVHELAHAVEIACLPAPEETAELRQQLTERKGGYRAGLINAIETPFPNAVVRAVMGEHDAVSDAGQLRVLAANFGLRLPSEANAAVDTSK